MFTTKTLPNMNTIIVMDSLPIFDSEILRNENEKTNRKTFKELKKLFVKANLPPPSL